METNNITTDSDYDDNDYKDEYYEGQTIVTIPPTTLRTPSELLEFVTKRITEDVFDEEMKGNNSEYSEYSEFVEYHDSFFNSLSQEKRYYFSRICDDLINKRVLLTDLEGPANHHTSNVFYINNGTIVFTYIADEYVELSDFDKKYQKWMRREIRNGKIAMSLDLGSIWGLECTNVHDGKISLTHPR